VPATNLFSDSSLSTRPLSYQWTFGDGSSSVLPSPNKVFNQAGAYVITLAIENDYGCRDTLTDTVNVYPEPMASLLADPDRGCAPMAVTFTNLSTGFSRSRWDFGDGSSLSTLTDPSYTYLATDTSFLVRLEVDTAGFCFDDTTYLIRVGSYPEANFEASVYEHCGPTEVSFTNLSTTARLPLNYQWDFGNGETSSLPNPTIRYEQPGNYTVQLLTRNSYGCPDSVTQLIEIVPQPEVLFVVNDPEGCADFAVQFTDLSQNVNGWTWDFGDGRSSNDQNPAHTYVAYGQYDVTLTANYDGRCADTLTQAEMILVQPSPIADFRYEDSLLTERPDGTIKFINLTQDGQNFRWDFGDGETSNDINPVHRYTVNDSFQVWLFAALGGCEDSTSQWIQPFFFGNLHVPNALAPLAGGPGEYTKFFPKGLGLTDYRIAVYSTWGDLVWESTALVDGVPTEWWDGTINGNLVTQDVFVWKVHRARFVGGREWPGPREGTITVIK
jgi:PKD repeat protein